MTEAWPSLFAALEAHARHRAEQTAVKFLALGEEVTASVTYRALMHRVTAAAAGLVARNLAARPVVLAFPPGIGFVTGFLACLRAGAIAVPVPFPPLRGNRERLRHIIADLRPAAFLVKHSDEASILSGGAPLIELEAVIAGATGGVPPLPAASDPAVIQYSSGSTRAPRGIVLSHGNIGSNAAMIRAAFDTGPGVVAVSWLPPYHDMGLFGAIVQPLFVGGTSVLMPPFAFLQRPLRWLRAIDSHRATIAGCPNFGYELCVRRGTREEADALDLSDWRIAFCGAEPVRAATLRRFATHFAGARFDPGSLMPCYGLAEASLLVAADHPGRGLRELDASVVAVNEGCMALSRVSCGYAPPGSRVTICDPIAPKLMPAGAIGEICVSGPHVAIGEWDGSSGTVSPLTRVAEGPMGLPMLRTGDLGVLSEEGLVVLDRLKDMICMHGRKICATDVEAAALEGAVEVVAAAAFAIGEEDAEEELVLLCEVAAAHRKHVDAAQLSGVLAQRVGEECGLVPRLALLSHGALPRTSSGKIRRQEARRRFLFGGLRSLGVVQA